MRHRWGECLKIRHRCSKGVLRVFYVGQRKGKSEARNPKQIQTLEIQNEETGAGGLGPLRFGF
jgi:hypothetical protein